MNLERYKLKAGDSGREVLVLKDLLYSIVEVMRAVPATQRSYNQPSRTDKYDDTAASAVSFFQRWRGLKVTGMMDAGTWEALAEHLPDRQVRHHTRHDKGLVVMMNVTSAAWPSQYSYITHQNSCERVLKTSLSKQDMDRLMFAVKDADRAEWQTVEYSYRHAMTPNGMSKDEAKRKANQFVRDEIGLAGRLYEQGNQSDGILQLGYGMHCLKDATSPAHAGFKEYGGGNLELASHVHTELFDPKEGSWLDEATKRSYSYFKGQLAMQGDLFANLGHDVWVPRTTRARRYIRRRTGW